MNNFLGFVRNVNITPMEYTVKNVLVDSFRTQHSQTKMENQILTILIFVNVRFFSIAEASLIFFFQFLEFGCDPEGTVDDRDCDMFTDELEGTSTDTLKLISEHITFSIINSSIWITVSHIHSRNSIIDSPLYT